MFSLLAFLSLALSLYIYIHMRVYLHVACVYIYIYIYTYIHTSVVLVHVNIYTYNILKRPKMPALASRAPSAQCPRKARDLEPERASGSYGFRVLRAYGFRA